MADLLVAHARALRLPSWGQARFIFLGKLLHRRFSDVRARVRLVHHRDAAVSRNRYGYLMARTNKVEHISALVFDL